MVSDRVRVQRYPDRASYDAAAVASILRAGVVCHVGFVDRGQPFVIPTAYGFDGRVIYIHGIPASRLVRVLRDGRQVCVTVTLVDGLVLARSLFNHAMNYRSVVVVGAARRLVEHADKLRGLRAVSDQTMPGRWDDARLPTPKELRQTHVLVISTTEASAKIRTGPPLDDEEDYALVHWAGVVPLGLTAGLPIPDPRMPTGRPAPPYLDRVRDLIAGPRVTGASPDSSR
jgi:uncharacterized protein